MLPHILHSHPIVKTDIVYGKDCYLYDSVGNKYIDFESGKWAASLGHNHPRLQKSLLNQLGNVSHLAARYTSQLAEQAAIRLLELVEIPNGKCLFLSSGSEAVEFGVQAARRISRKPVMLTFSDSYLAAFGSAGSKQSSEWYCLDWTVCSQCEKNQTCAPDCQLIQQIPWSKIGGFVYEPGNSAGFVQFPPDELVRSIARLVQERGGLVVVNEITTGIGRTGRWFGYQHAGIHPDIIAIGKGLGGGYPVSAVALSRPVAEALEGSDYHYCQSHQNDPLGCAVALEVLDVIRDEGLVERSDRLGWKFKNALIDLAARYPQIREVRGRGLMIAVEFDNELAPKIAGEIFTKLLNKGMMVGANAVSNIIRMYPPLTINESDIDLFLEKLTQTLDEVIYDK